MTDTRTSPAPSPAPVSATPKGLAISALVVGIAALALSFLGWIAVALGAVAVILGIVALVKRQSKGMSIAGIVTGALGAIGGAIVAIVLSLMIGAVVSTVEQLEEGERAGTVEQIEDGADAEGAAEVVDPRTDALYASDDAVNEALAALSARLDEVAPELAGVGVTIYGQDLVNVSIVVEDERETPSVPASALRAVLDELAAFEAPALLTEWQISGWDVNAWNVDVLQPSDEISVNTEFVDQEWNRINIPADRVADIF